MCSKRPYEYFVEKTPEIYFKQHTFNSGVRDLFTKLVLSI